MLLRITWKNDGFYRLNIPVLPLCEKTVILNCEAKRSNPIPPSGDRPKDLIQGKLRKVISDTVIPDSTHGAKLRASSLLATAPDQKFLPELTILEIIEAPQQSHCARHFNIVSTIIKGTAVSFAVFFLSFFAMNYEAYWDIAEHSWAKSVRPKVMQASSLFFSGNNDAEIIKIAVIKDATETAKPLASILQSKTHLEPAPVNTLEPVALTPPDHRLIIPKIGKNVPIVESKADNLYSKNWPELEKELLSDLKRGVVHYPGTAFPGQKGNVFLTGHSSYYPWDDGEYKDVFALLGKIEVGDEIVLFYKQKEYRYKVSDIRQVKPNNVDILKQTDDNRLTLMTCTPVGTTLRRLVITALQV